MAAEIDAPTCVLKNYRRKKDYEQRGNLSVPERTECSLRKDGA